MLWAGQFIGREWKDFMAKKFTKPRGTEDVLPQDSWKWLALEDAIRSVAARFGYREIRLPTFEATELFSRGVGEDTDVVAKEMYTFLDKGGRSITLRPEGTAAVARAVLEHGLLASQPLPLKSYYVQSCFRYERAQKGRLREFHQFGIECFGTHEAAADVEVMAVARFLFEELGVSESVTLEINSIGCPECRPAYHEKLRAYFKQYEDELCPTCKERLARNPMRILDCKEEKCQAIAKDAPVILDSLCEDCKAHYDETKALLAEAGMAYTENPRIVRGLDYYTNTVFEFIAEGVGTQGTVCGGGRYDGLIEELGGQHTPAAGFGLGLERLLMLLEEQDKLPGGEGVPQLYAVGADAAGRAAARQMTLALRRSGFWAECDLSARSVKAQMKAAGRMGALYTAVLGEAEAQSGQATLKDMNTKAEWPLALADPAEGLQEALFRDMDGVIGGAEATAVIDDDYKEGE